MRETKHVGSQGIGARLRRRTSSQRQTRSGSCRTRCTGTYRFIPLLVCPMGLDLRRALADNAALPRYTQSASGLDRQLIDDMSNLVTLRRDIRFLFDSRRFTFVPKQNAKTCCLVLHVLSLDTDFINSELVPMYHNLSPGPLMGISIQHLFARFAWSLFSEPIMPFLKGMAEYRVLLFDPEMDEAKEAKLRATEIRSNLTIFDAPLRSRSASPRKRQRDSSAQDDYSEAGGGRRRRRGRLY